MKIEITQECIDNAQRANSTHCMIADAIQQQYNVQHVMVDVQSIRFSRPGTDKRYTYLTPKLAQKQILAFDRGEPLAPWSFRLHVPTKVEPIRHKPESSEATRQKARADYEQRTNHRGTKSTKGYTRERQYGVRIADAHGSPQSVAAVDPVGESVTG